jgi:hypothetical protein
VTQRPIEVCDADKPICPRCAKPFRRIWIQDGLTYAFCERLAPDAKPGERRVCGQHVALLGEDGVVAVSPLSREEFESLKTHAKHVIAMRRAIRLSFVAVHQAVATP